MCWSSGCSGCAHCRGRKPSCLQSPPDSMPSGSFGRFILLVFAWLACTLFVWWLASALLAWPIGLLAELVSRVALADLVQGVEQHGDVITFVTTLHGAKATVAAAAGADPRGRGAASRPQPADRLRDTAAFPDLGRDRRISRGYRRRIGTRRCVADRVQRLATRSNRVRLPVRH